MKNLDQHKTEAEPVELENECEFCGEACEDTFCSEWCKRGYAEDNY